ncbi:NAD(P)-dependent oxidoreductase [Rhodovulum sp. 12E13]|uniref:NAD(P)-dependent oxidoreductase n=1 Tax=Rhodovulum sp. 12E13 TaxID=2203891 RepID=UPI000E16ED62|nr:NAD(P)-dependent oxidoreductase [Rhodovulum sp. 12E13]RDC74017.1 NAD(P)-dependent oxidoreductase [Rhodovulum sp. 12E13]
MRVAVVGLGRMGAPMARNLARAGHDLVLWNRTRDKAAALGAQIGAGVVDTPRAAAAGAEAVVTMLADDPSSEAVHHGPDGLFAAGGPRVMLEMGTMSPDHIRALAAEAPEGVTVIDAPVSGATQAAADAQLLIMAGCAEGQAAPLRPLLDAMGRKTICLGAVGAGAIMKLAVNSLIHGLNQTLAEAVTLAEAAGIPREAAFDVIGASAAAAPMIGYRRPLYLDEAAHDVTFTVALAKKDMAVTAALAEALGTAMPQGRVTLDILEEAERAGFGARDLASILTFMGDRQA